MRARLGVIAVRPISADPEREVTEEVMQVLSRARRDEAADDPEAGPEEIPA